MYKIITVICAAFLTANSLFSLTSKAQEVGVHNTNSETLVPDALVLRLMQVKLDKLPYIMNSSYGDSNSPYGNDASNSEELVAIVERAKSQYAAGQYGDAFVLLKQADLVRLPEVRDDIFLSLLASVAFQAGDLEAAAYFNEMTKFSTMLRAGLLQCDQDFVQPVIQFKDGRAASLNNDLMADVWGRMCGGVFDPAYRPSILAKLPIAEQRSALSDYIQLQLQN